MAGFFGLFDYTKPGKGVRKDEPQKGRFFHFWELFFRKFWKLIQLNVLFLVFCIPIVTIGPAMAGLTYVLRNMVNEQPVFLFSDLWDAFKLNWKQSFIYSVLVLVCGVLVLFSADFYLAASIRNSFMYLPVALTFLIALMLVLMNFYGMLMIVTLELPLLSIIKNALILAIVCLKTNLLTLLFTALILFGCYTFPGIGMLLTIIIVPAWIGFIICYNSYPGVKKYAIDPFLREYAEPSEAAKALEPPLHDDTVFSDELKKD